MWQWFDKDNIVSERPCRLQQIVACGADQQDGRFVLYDGLNTNGRLFAHVRVEKDTTRSIIFPTCPVLSEGLYLDIVGSIDGVLVVWDSPEE